jgi:endonuclease YncB( thermonuclease family)
MSDSTHITEDVWPEPADLSEEPTIASGLHIDSTPTSEYPAFTSEPQLTEDTEDDEWPVRAPAKGVRLGIPATIVVVVLLLALGFWGGAIAQKNHGTASAAGPAGLAARLRNAANGATGATGATGAGGFQLPGGAGGTGGSGATTGTVSVVDGDTLYVLTASNQLVKVTLNPSTTVTRNANAKAVQLRPGDTVVVQGSTGAGGNVKASSVAATAKGVSSTAGGFGGLGGGGFTPGGAGGGLGQGTPGG